MSLDHYITQLQGILFVAPVILLAIICHECAHGWVSYKLGDPTPKEAGRLSLNPLRHLDPVGTLCLLVFHMGWAKPVPVNPYYYKDKKKGLIAVSLAGPAVNFILAFISLLIEALLLKFGSTESEIVWIAVELCYYSAVINAGLGLFNLIPIPPLDGSKILGSLSTKVSEIYWKGRQIWRTALIVLLVTGVLSTPLATARTLLLDVMWSLVSLIFHFVGAV